VGARRARVQLDGVARQLAPVAGLDAHIELAALNADGWP
jgi:hypothetical protein